MCMRAAESDGVGRREREEKGGAAPYDALWLVESWLPWRVKEEGVGGEFPVLHMITQTK